MHWCIEVSYVKPNNIFYLNFIPGLLKIERKKGRGKREKPNQQVNRAHLEFPQLPQSGAVYSAFSVNFKDGMVALGICRLANRPVLLLL